MIETPQQILGHIASDDAARAFVDYRKGMGKRYHLTARAAGMILKSLEAIRDNGGDPDEALDMAQERGWMTVKPDWYWRSKQAENPKMRVINGDRDANGFNSRPSFGTSNGRQPTSLASIAAQREFDRRV